MAEDLEPRFHSNPQSESEPDIVSKPHPHSVSEPRFKSNPSVDL